MTQYDKIAGPYDRMNEERPDRGRILTPSAKHYLGDIRGLNVLELACGSGYFSRRLKAWGAASVLGIDISREMIELALRKDEDDPAGIQYRVADVASLGKLGTFDLAFAGFLLHYAPTKEALARMCAHIASNLKPGARFVALNENPAHPLHRGVKYEVEIAALGPIADGSVVQLSHCRDGVRAFSFSHHHYEPATYRAALEAAGFSKIEWKPFIKGAGADEGFAPGYWDEFTSGDFSIAVLICEKS